MSSSQCHLCVSPIVARCIDRFSLVGRLAASQHCRLVQIVDEADRLLKQAYQQWLPKLLSASAGSQDPARTGVSMLPLPQRLVKIVASATLTHDPAKLAALQLHAPRCSSYVL